MATSNQIRTTSAKGIHPGEAHVILRLVVVRGDAPSERLEELAFEALAVVEQHAGEIALGAAVACNLAENAIILDFDVETLISSEIHQRIADVMALLEREMPLTSYGSETVVRPSPCA